VTTELLKVENISKSFGGLKAVQNVSFSVNSGEILGIIGPNGAGKTTLFHLISGFLLPDAGCVTFNGRKITGLKPHQISLSGLTRTFQIVRPFRELSVIDNVSVGALSHCADVKQAQQFSGDVLQQIRMRDIGNQRANNLTLADYKRLELARILATKPKLILLDEVMAGLTPAEIDQMIELVQTLVKKGITVIAIEHVMKAIMALSDRIVVMDNGQVIATGKPQEITTNRQVIQAYLGSKYVLSNDSQS
jgi:branched-chain amino acid transport system ATP-binding protein